MPQKYNPPFLLRFVFICVIVATGEWLLQLECHLAEDFLSQLYIGFWPRTSARVQVCTLTLPLLLIIPQYSTIIYHRPLRNDTPNKPTYKCFITALVLRPLTRQLAGLEWAFFAYNKKIMFHFLYNLRLKRLSETTKTNYLLICRCLASEAF
jgi:hypothetical protein